jgi:Acetyltransferase (GNAT) domain
MTSGRGRTQLPADVKVELVLRLLGGETLADVARDSGRPKRQLSAWRRRFIAGGQEYLDGGPERPEVEALQRAHDEQSARVAELEVENALLARQVRYLHPDARPGFPHAYCSAPYARAFEEPGVRPLHVPEWGAYVLVREGPGGTQQAIGIRPISPLEPGCDVRAGLETLRQAGIASVSLVAEPLWSPEPSVLRQAFRICRPFREHYFVDLRAEIHYHKRHRNRLNQALRVCTVEEVRLDEHLERWHELYAHQVANRQNLQPFTRAYFERIATLPSMQTIAVLAHGEIVAMTLWIRHADTLYLHDGAANATGFDLSATYAAVAHAIDTEQECRYILLGGSAGLHDDPLEGLAMFRRGFSNGSVSSHLCSARLN